MEKYPLTSAGIANLQAFLYSLSDDKLAEEAVLIAADPCGWIPAHIELQVHQLECLRTIQQDFMQMFGWNIAAALLARRPVAFSYRPNLSANGRSKNACILYHCKVSSHWADSHHSSTGSLEIVITE